MLRRNNTDETKVVQHEENRFSMQILYSKMDGSGHYIQQTVEIIREEKNVTVRYRNDLRKIGTV